MTPLLLALQITAMPDAHYLTATALQWGHDPRVVLAMAWEETRSNVSPAVRGKAGEIGRFQLSRAVARRYCPDLRIERYHDNVRCYMRTMSYYMVELDLPGLLPVNAIERYNGRGPKARAYRERVLATVRRL